MLHSISAVSVPLISSFGNSHYIGPYKSLGRVSVRFLFGIYPVMFIL